MFKSVSTMLMDSVKVNKYLRSIKMKYLIAWEKVNVADEVDLGEGLEKIVL